MTFRQIVWKMAKAQYKKYIFYYLCNSFAVMFFFMFSTVYFNSRIEQSKKLDGIQDALTIPGAALIVFTVFFISYAHNVFMKRRRSEFGLFMTLGMSQRDLSKLLLLENGAIAISSIASGLLAGAIFSRIFFMLLISSINLEEVPFHFSSKMFVYSIGAFLIVFLLAVGKSLLLTLRSSLVQSMKSNRVAETIKLRSPIIGAMGLLLLAGSMMVLYFTYSESTGGYLLLWTMTMLIGLYISISQFSSFLIEFAKKSPGFYYRRLLFLTSLDYKFKQLTSILMLVTVMIMITIFYSTLLLTFYNSAEKDAINNNPYDLAFFQTETKNNISDEDLNVVLDIKEQLVIPVINHYQKHEYAEGNQLFTLMSLDDFNRLTSKQQILQDKEFLFYINSDPGFGHADMRKTLTLSTGSEGETYALKEKIVEKNINWLPNVYEFIVVNEKEFGFLRNNLNGIEFSLHLINVTDWKVSDKAVEDLKDKLAAGNLASPPLQHLNTHYTSEELFRVASKIGDYHHNRNSSGIMFYVTTFLSIMFFFGTFVLLYLNLFSEIEAEKAKYKKLYKIGMTSKEVKGNITRELITLFFVPTLIGTGLAFLYLVILSTDVGGIMKNPDILMHFGLISSSYLCIQAGSFFYARKKMMDQLIN